MTPIEHFNKWFKEEINYTKVRIPSACCLSTVGIEGFPNARFVSLKEIVENNFIITGSLTSRKGIEIGANNKVALTFWWTETERQVRIQGNATKITDQRADKYFAERNRESQIVSIVSNQGQKLNDITELEKKYQSIEKNFTNKPLTRPKNWSGYLINPIGIEFLEFKTTRFHKRNFYEFKNGEWICTELEP